MDNKFIAAMAGIAMLGAGSAAQAATVVDNFSFTDSSSTVLASGSFSYDFRAERNSELRRSEQLHHLGAWVGLQPELR